ncbi:MAG: hypothetical protein ACTSP4_00840 [Candidatus Hodarchaeales archaeon]
MKTILDRMKDENIAVQCENKERRINIKRLLEAKGFMVMPYRESAFTFTIINKMVQFVSFPSGCEIMPYEKFMEIYNAENKSGKIAIIQGRLRNGDIMDFDNIIRKRDQYKIQAEVYEEALEDVVIRCDAFHENDKMKIGIIRNIAQENLNQFKEPETRSNTEFTMKEFLLELIDKIEKKNLT